MTIASFIRALLGAFDRNAFTSLLDGTFLTRARAADADPRGIKLRLQAAAVLLSLYAGMHLTVAGTIHLLNPGDVRDASGTPMTASAAGVLDSVYGPDPSPANDSLGGTPDDARACPMSFVLDSDSLID
jgi:hypothetical protein